jgi:hypothetical protein
MITSVFWLLWTWWRRKDQIVQASQPFFLYQICLGTLVMAATIIPMSLQEPISQRGLDVACMSIPWFLSIGYCIAFSAILSKTWRIKEIFNAGIRCRRTHISVYEARFPLVVLGGINTVLLICWTATSPLKWVRVDLDSYDEYERTNESAGRCESDDSQVSLIIPILLAAVNVLALLFTNYQCYLARHVPSDFNEAHYVTITNASLLEVLILGVPILLVANQEPSIQFGVRSFIIAVLCFCILLPIFLPKFLRRQDKQELNVREAWKQASTRLMLASNPQLNQSRSMLNNGRSSEPLGPARS